MITESTSRIDAVASMQQIRDLIDKAARLLPTQGPIEVFVYRNTLQAFEDQSFHDGVKAGAERYHANAYLPETEYRRLCSVGRITDGDLEIVVQDELGAKADESVAGLSTRHEIRFAMLRHPLHFGPDAELRWIVAETDALQRFQKRISSANRTQILSSTKKWLQDSGGIPESISCVNDVVSKFGRNFNKWTGAQWESFSLHLTWRICLNGVSSAALPRESSRYVRPRDLLLHATGEDIDRNVHDLLIRFCAAYVDQGYSDWLLPNRDQGFYESFLALYSTKSSMVDRWLKGLPEELSTLRYEKVSPEMSIEASMEELGIEESDREEFITQSLLALGGWAGMIWQLESGVDWVVHSIPPGSLTGMLAVQLILEKHAIRNLGAERFDACDSISSILHAAQNSLNEPAQLNCEREAFLVFQVAQMLGWTPFELQQLSESEWKQLVNEVVGFSSLERRRTFHEAYEHKYRQATLNAFAIHSERRQAALDQRESRPSFQIVTCIDDREESFRRHLEEVQPACETFGAAGFFAVAMYYRGVADGFYKPLCPDVITPQHYVQEDIGYSFEGVHKNRAQLRRSVGLAGYLFQTRSRTFFGGMFAGIMGTVASVPLVGRVLFPGLVGRIRSRFGSLLQPPPVTSLTLERTEAKPGPDNGHIGYTTDEMADIVVRLLQDLGLTATKNFSRLCIICGHGSSSLNNPHESGYCCGACAGKRGGPNARAFAQMANDWRVRKKVAENGIDIPDDTTFVGAYHDTCADSVVYYDLDRLPVSHRKDFENARSAIEEALERNAHERCRRFASAPLNWTPTEAIKHVRARGQDIAQPRPEYDHATNSLCVVGRRNWSRGLFLDRRSFLTSYDPAIDDENSSILFRILSAAIPVCAGINLSFLFSTVDNKKYGSGSKLPHNVVSLLGVMEGTSSDLRTGVYQQVCEIHEPTRLTFVIETTPDAMLSIMDRNPTIGRLVRGAWVHLAVIDPKTSAIEIFKDGEFQPFEVSNSELGEVNSSLEHYQNTRDHLPCVSIRMPEVNS